MSWRIETANPFSLMRELPAAWAQTCFLRPPYDLPDPYLAAMLDEVHRVLREDGTLWIAFPGRGSAPQLLRLIEENGWLRPGASGPSHRHRRIGDGVVTLFTKRAEFHFNPRAPLLTVGCRSQMEVCPARAGSHGRISATRHLARRAWCVPARGQADTLTRSVLEWCLLAGTSPRACGVCGAPWKRLPAAGGQSGRWRPGCSHSNGRGRCLVVEPFCGLGGVGAVAVRLGRNYLGVEDNERVAALARARLSDIDHDEGPR
jgi:hypothetical protein